VVVAYLLISWDSTNCGPLNWLVFMKRNEPLCGLPIGGLIPSCVSVFVYRFTFRRFTSILRIARSIDPAPLFSSYYSTVGPGLAVVGTPGSPLDIIQTKVHLPHTFVKEDSAVLGADAPSSAAVATASQPHHTALRLHFSDHRIFGSFARQACRCRHM